MPIWKPKHAASAICLVEFVLQGGFLSGAGLRLPAAHGRAGISAHKHEGDGATPTGLLGLVRVLYRADRLKPPACSVPIEPISPQDGWCDDPANPAYNKQIRLPFAASHEALWRDDNLYDIIGILDWNFAPITRHRGSAIFLHVATPDYAPTAGCVALALSDVLTALRAGLSEILVRG